MTDEQPPIKQPDLGALVREIEPMVADLNDTLGGGAYIAVTLNWTDERGRPHALKVSVGDLPDEDDD